MRGYYIVPGILLIINFAVAAPAPVQEKNKDSVGISAAHMPEDAATILGKRGDVVEDIWVDYLRNEGELSKVSSKPKPKPDSSAAKPPPPAPPPPPPPPPPPSGPADGRTQTNNALSKIPLVSEDTVPMIVLPRSTPN